VEVQYVEVASVLVQWVRLSVVNQLRDLEFHTGAQMVMKLNHLLPKMEQ
jgi:hypothetical protein